MKKTITIFIVIVFKVAIIKSQNLVPVGTGIPSSYGIYGGTVTYNNEIYATDINSIYKWDGVNWNNLGIVTDGNILCTKVYNGELYVGGWFENFNGIPMNRIARYNGTTWQPVGSGILIPFAGTGGIEKMEVYNGKLIVLGSISTAGGVNANNIASWDGTIWSSLGSGISSPGSLPAMTVYSGELYVFSQISSAGGLTVNNAAKWDGTNWTAVGSGINKWPISATVYNNAIYVGLWISGGNHNSMIVKWDGLSWSDVEQDTSNTSWNIVMDLKAYNGCLYAVGYIDTINGVNTNNVARYDGNFWYPVGNGLDNSPNFLTELYGDLYVTGRFANSGSTSVQNVAKLNNPSICSTGFNEIYDPNETFTIFPNPFTSQTTINFAELQTKTIIRITNILGKEIKTITFSGMQLIIEKEEMEEGIYTVQTIDEKKRVSNRKIIVQ